MYFFVNVVKFLVKNRSHLTTITLVTNNGSFLLKKIKKRFKKYTVLILKSENRGQNQPDKRSESRFSWRSPAPGGSS